MATKKKKKWDDKKEGKKPWEHGYVAPKKPKPPAAPTPGKKPAGPGSMAEDVITELEKKRKGLRVYRDTGILPKKKKGK